MLVGVEDERLDHTLSQEDGNTLAGEGASDAKAVAQNGHGDHLVLRDFGEELVVRGLRVCDKKKASSVSRIGLVITIERLSRRTDPL